MVVHRHLCGDLHLKRRASNDFRIVRCGTSDFRGAPCSGDVLIGFPSFSHRTIVIEKWFICNGPESLPPDYVPWNMQDGFGQWRSGTELSFHYTSVPSHSELLTDDQVIKQGDLAYPKVYPELSFQSPNGQVYYEMRLGHTRMGVAWSESGLSLTATLQMSLMPSVRDQLWDYGQGYYQYPWRTASGCCGTTWTDGWTSVYNAYDERVYLYTPEESYWPTIDWLRSKFVRNLASFTTNVFIPGVSKSQWDEAVAAYGLPNRASKNCPRGLRDLFVGKTADITVSGGGGFFVFRNPSPGFCRYDMITGVTAGTRSGVPLYVPGGASGLELFSVLSVNWNISNGQGYGRWGYARPPAQYTEYCSNWRTDGPSANYSEYYDYAPPGMGLSVYLPYTD